MKKPSTEEPRNKRNSEALGCLIVLWLGVVIGGQVIQVTAMAGIGWAMVVLFANVSMVIAAMVGAFIARSTR